MAGLIIGELGMHNGCLSIINGARRISLIFVPELEVTHVDEGIQVANTITGKTVLLHMGERVSIGGGNVLLTSLTGVMETRVPNNCSEPYWLAGSIE